MLKLKHIAHKDIDFKKWDKTILSSDFPLVFAQSFYLNATSPNWDALVIGDYESVFPLTYKSKFGFKYLPQPSFTSQLGVFGKINEKVERLFYDYICENFKLIEIELNASNKIKNKNISPKKTFVINYVKGYKYNQNTKRNIKKALDSELLVEKVDAKKSISVSKKIMNSFLEKELKLSKSVINIFNALVVNSLNANSLLTLNVIDKNNSIKAIAHFVFNNKHALYLKGTNLDKKENSGSMHLLIDAAIKYFDGKVDVFDFGGGSMSESLAGFYQGLGGQPLNYSFLKINQLPRFVKVLKGKKS
ncbi:MAG: hypothetical protein Q7W45_17405 [Bacteroidota bacterium]|nr:hypothetical protein [Bacteroidota bacterium]MDP3145206.1 hypothetical protein [Bacteroidota bacterium]MDP3557269.1 hypothetical protein [Bacteroidota bacterium]